jgi:hypothetical protein
MGAPMKLRKNNQGFSVIEALLILFILGIIGFVGYFVWHSQKAADKTYSQTDTSSSPTVTKKTSAVVGKTDAQKYLVIKEWGVKIPYTSTDTLTYTITDGSDEMSLQVASSTLAGKYGIYCSTFGSGGIFRLSGTDAYDVDGNVTVAQAYSSNHESMTKLGAYYYRFIHDQGACSDNESVADGNAANDFLKSILPNIQAAQ